MTAVPATQSLERKIARGGQVYHADEREKLEQIAEMPADVATDNLPPLRVDQSTPFRHFVAVKEMLKVRRRENLPTAAWRGAVE